VNEARCWLSAFGHYVPHPSKFPPPNTMIEGDPHILGRVITVGHTALTVVGVTPPHWRRFQLALLQLMPCIWKSFGLPTTWSQLFSGPVFLRNGNALRWVSSGTNSSGCRANLHARRTDLLCG